MPAPKGHPPYNKNGEGGRPKKWDSKSLDELAESLDNWINDAVESKKEFWWWDWCWAVGLNQDKVKNYARSHERFRRSYENAKNWQESIVARFALTKKFSEGFSKFILVNHYSDNWKEKSATTSNTSPNDQIIDDQHAEMSEKNKLRKRVAELEAQIEQCNGTKNNQTSLCNESKTGSEF